MEERYKVCLACTSIAVEGCENMTLEEAQSWVWEKTSDDEPYVSECGDTKKYIVVSLDINPNEKHN
jgi:hypothetical protein